MRNYESYRRESPRTIDALGKRVHTGNNHDDAPLRDARTAWPYAAQRYTEPVRCDPLAKRVHDMLRLVCAATLAAERGRFATPRNEGGGGGGYTSYDADGGYEEGRHSRPIVYNRKFDYKPPQEA